MSSSHCEKDGGFIGDAGCSHPNHEYSEFAKSLINSEPRRISPEDCDRLLREGIYVESSEHRRVGFGKSLLRHLTNHHTTDDYTERKRNLLYAIDTVKKSKPVTHNEKGFEGRTKWVNKSYDDKIILVVSSKDKKAAEANLDIDYVFTIRKDSKRK